MTRDFVALDTFPKILRDNAVIFKGRPSIREKEYGIWQITTWNNFFDKALLLAEGFYNSGLRRGDKIAIIGDNRPNLYLAIASAQILGAIPVPCYQDSVADEIQYILEHAEAKLAVVENQEQVDKLLEIKEKLPLLKNIFYSDPRGLEKYNEKIVSSLETILKNSKEIDVDLDQEINKTSKDDISIMLYTSGTTGRPKGVLLSYNNIISVTSVACEIEKTNPDDEVVAYLPMAWVGDNIFCVAQSYISGFCINCPESRDTLTLDMREIGPTYYFAPPRVWEGMLTQLMVRMQDASKVKLWVFNFFMKTAKKWGNLILDKEKVPFAARMLYGLGYFLIYGPLKNNLGLTRVRMAYTAGEAMGPDTFLFYRSLGINLKVLYGQTEATVFVSLHRDGDVDPNTVGPAFPGVDIKITDGEVFYKGPGVFKGYYKNEEATKETIDKEGWVKTGDAGVIDSNGHLKIIDRAKDVGKLNSGNMFAPKYIENKLKFCGIIKEAVAFGDNKDFVTCFINIDLEAVASWAERNNIAYSGYIDLAGQSTVYNLIASEIDKVNRDLSQDTELNDSQIKRFLILHKELDADDGELTRTNKVRRGLISERYGMLVDAFYNKENHCFIETEVTFEDGRKGSISADLKIQDMNVYDLKDQVA
ncbi:MAG: long-chain fatty acid--CoA ligase [Pelagibacterales bacterium]|nr:long-chain fatty acid--CoA ligase [Pelagibacterales bacterium]|tara:strand:+ start:2924 stop:4861 length:1938 start_codon:yes stop_codon:yes gene_type:complete